MRAWQPSPPEQAKVAPSPPYNSANGAYIDIPGPYEKGQASIYYIAPPDPSWTPKEQQEYLAGRADLLFTSVHEVWPGHFLQFLHSNRDPSIVGRLFVGYAFAEGWAHYAEEMMWEMGLGNGDPETHVGQLKNALLRDARFLSAIGLHTAGMTVADSEKMFREQAYQDVGTARQQAARGTYDPAYLNYTMGKLMIRKLRADWTATRGGRTAWRHVPRRVSQPRRPADSDAQAADAGKRRGKTLLARDRLQVRFGVQQPLAEHRPHGERQPPAIVARDLGAPEAREHGLRLPIELAELQRLLVLGRVLPQRLRRRPAGVGDHHVHRPPDRA